MLQEMLMAAQMGCTLDPFVYHIDFAPATASTTTTGQFLVQSDAAFMILRTTAVVMSTTNAGVATLQPFGSGVDASLNPFLVTLMDQGAGRNLQSLPQNFDGIFGTAQKPYDWIVPKILDANSAFTVTLQNLSATDRNVRLDFHGAKVFGNVAAFISKLKVQ